jgi:hypothetical protein
VLTLALLAPLGGCASSRSLLDAPVLPGESELYAASEERVLRAATATVDAVGLGVDEVVDREDRRIVLASRGLGWWDYGAIARVVVEPAGTASGGSWVHVTSRLRMGSNIAGKSDYREDIFGGIHAALAEELRGSARPLPEVALAPRVTNPLVVGTPLRLGGRRQIVTALEGASITVDDGLGTSPRTLTPTELDAMGDVERLIREPYHWERFFLASAVGIGLGFLFAEMYSSDYYGDSAWIYGVTFGVGGVIGGAVWGNRGRTRWQAMP